jgi:hypothetical protein
MSENLPSIQVTPAMAVRFARKEQNTTLYKEVGSSLFPAARLRRAP